MSQFNKMNGRFPAWITLFSLGAGCLASSVDDLSPEEASSLPQMRLLAEYEAYFDENGLLQYRRVGGLPDLELDFGIAGRREAINDITPSSAAYGRGANPADTIEIVTCRATTEPTCDTPYGEGSWSHFPPTSTTVEGQTDDPAECGALPPGSDETCLVYDIELRNFRTLSGTPVDVSNVYYVLRNFRDNNNTPGNTSDDYSVTGVYAYGGANPNLITHWAGTFNVPAEGTVFRYGTLEPSNRYTAPANSTERTSWILNPPFQAGLRRVRIRFPNGYTRFKNLLWHVRIFGTLPTSTNPVPYQVSVTDKGDPTNGEHFQAAHLSDNGEYIVFQTSYQLSSNHPYGTSQIYRFHRLTGKVELVSVSEFGDAGNGNSSNPWISGNGRFVVFESQATNLVGSDTNGVSDIFLRDIEEGITIRISVNWDGTQATNCGGVGSTRPHMTSDGQFIVFQSGCASLCGGGTNCQAGRLQVYRVQVTRDDNVWPPYVLSLSGVSLVNGLPSTWGNGDSRNARVSNDGSRVVFTSISSNLVSPDSSNNDVFVRNIPSNTTIRITHDVGVPLGATPSISGNGNLVVFETTDAQWLTGSGGTLQRIARCPTNSGATMGSCQLVSGIAPNLFPASNPHISFDGRYVVFDSQQSGAGNRQVYVRDMNATTPVVVVVSRNSFGTNGSGNSSRARITPNGRYIVFESAANNLQADSDGNFDNDSNLDVFVIRNPLMSLPFSP
ncbi:MAG: hypothetical protein NZM37_10615 [Sandaracinaceae bacterium]|nr:hypothetical protein [Sandaracinaceae bacterium]